MPVIPPSNKWLGIIKPFIAITAQIAPRTMNIIDLILKTERQFILSECDNFYIL